MRKFAILLASMCFVLFVFAHQNASAKTNLPHLKLLDTSTKNQTLVQKVHHGYCVRWRRICAVRWGWGTWRWRRCLRLHGC